MSRLSKGLVGQGNLSAIEKHSEEILTHNGKKDIVVIPLYQICSRYENMYINSTENNKRLRNSIEKIGLITPIAVIPIDKYKPNSKDEKAYLEQMKNYGCLYFISSGHRRFRACVSIALGKDIESKKDLEDFYKYVQENRPYDRFDAFSEEEVDDQNKWYVDCVIVDKELEKENQIYNDTNLTARATTTFELLINSLDEMKKEGITWTTNADIQAYIKSKRGVDISLQTIKNLMIIINNSDAELLDVIFEGKITVKQAKDLISSYRNMSEEEKKDVIKEIWKGAFDIKKYKEKRSQARRETWSSADVEELLLRIKMKEISIEEALKLVRK